MPFHYLIKPGSPTSKNPFSARPDPQTTVEADEFLADVARRAGVERAVVEKVIVALFASIAAFLRDTRPIAAILDIFRVAPLAGGSYATATPDDQAIRDTTGFSLQILTGFLKAFQLALPLVKSGQEGPVVPVLDSVVALPGKQANSYHLGGALEVRGSHLRRPGEAALPTATIADPDGSNPVPLPVLDASNRKATIGLPATGLNGPKILMYHDGEHAVTYATTLQPI